MRNDVRIAICDLRHTTVGKHCADTPVGIGYISSYAKSQLNATDAEFQLYTSANEVSRDIIEWKPHLLALSNYCWNTSLSYSIIKYAKKLDPTILCVMGGPEFPTEKAECHAYLSTMPDLDLYVFDSANGESAFAEIVNAYCLRGASIRILKSNPPSGSMAIDPASNSLTGGLSAPRLKDRDEIPSPYLTGMLDKWLTAEYVPALETARGCPFKCGYCHTGNNLNHYTAFSVRRITDELEYICNKSRNTQNKRLSIFDSNFGMYPRDLEIARFIRTLMDKYDWPLNIDASSGKEKLDRLLEVTEMLKYRLCIGMSRQTNHPPSEAAISRKNIPWKRYLSMAREFEKRSHTPTVCELIVPLPEETLKSYYRGQKKLIDAGIDSGANYTTMMLRGTRLASAEYRQKYDLKTKFRLLPRQFGTYNSERVFEVEKVCISTNTLSFNDYLDIRGFSLIVLTFSSEPFSIIHRHLKELGVSMFDFMVAIHNAVKSDACCISKGYEEFLQEVKAELCDSRDDVRRFFSEENNYQKLLKGELGDNLSRKYLARLFLTPWSQLLDLSYETMSKLAGHGNADHNAASLNAARKWAQIVMDVNALLVDESLINNEWSLTIDYDVLSWYQDAGNGRTVDQYRADTTYKIFYDKQKVSDLLVQAERMDGRDERRYLLGGLLWRHWNVRDLWRHCQKQTEDKRG